MNKIAISLFRIGCMLIIVTCGKIIIQKKTNEFVEKKIQEELKKKGAK